MKTSAVLSVRLCGGLVVGHGTAALGPRRGGAKARHVLLALVFEAGSPVSKGRLIEFLWGDRPPAGALGTLEAYVSVLRKHLASVIPGAAPVVTVPGGYRWDVDSAPVDVVEFAHLASEARAMIASGGDALRAYAAALSLVERPLPLEDADLSWLQHYVTGHQARVVRVLVEAARVALDARDLVRAEAWARAALEQDVLLECAWLVLIEALEGQGREAEAVREYETCRSVLAAELGCDPGPTLRAAFTRLLSATSVHDDGLRDLVDAVVRLHVGLLADGSSARTVGRVPVLDDREGHTRREPMVLASLQEDCRRLQSLLRAVSGGLPVDDWRALTQVSPLATA